MQEVIRAQLCVVTRAYGGMVSRQDLRLVVAPAGRLEAGKGLPVGPGEFFSG